MGTEETTVDIMFNDMDLQIMGKIIPNGQKLTGDMIKKIGFMIMDKNTEPFELHVMKIQALGNMADQEINHAHADHSHGHSQEVHSFEVDYAEYFDHRWYSVNDDVMGGKSTGTWSLGNGFGKGEAWNAVPEGPTGPCKGKSLKMFKNE